MDRPLTKFLEKDMIFNFDLCINVFNILKEKLINSPIVVAPNWSLPFDLMCDTSNFAVGAVLGQYKDKHFGPIYYASKTLMDVQENYTPTEKELLTIIFAFDELRSHVIISKVIVYTNYSALKYLLNKQDAKPRLIRWILLLQEFDIKIKNKKGTKNLAADHLPRLENNNVEKFFEEDINDILLDEKLYSIDVSYSNIPWYADIANFLTAGILPKGMTHQQKKKFLYELRHYLWEDQYLFYIYVDNIIRRYVAYPD